MDNENIITQSVLKFVTGDNSHICRLCFVSTENEEVSIHDTVRVQRSYFDESVCFVDMFEELGVTVEALLPQVLCMNCAVTIINSYLFHKLHQYSNEKWHAALQKLEESLTQSELINPNTKSTIIIINKNENLIITSRKHFTAKNKTSVVTKIKNIFNSRKTYALKKKTKNKVCDECGERFHSDLRFTNHMKSHNKVIYTNTRIPCPQCTKYFATKMQMEDHMERIHYPKTVKCSKCPKMFGTLKMLRRHEKLNHIAAICKLCFVQFPSKCTLKAHLDKHDVNKCEQCNKTFLNKHTFKMHLKICGNPDTRQPNYFCDLCNRGYARKNSLRTHLKTDHGFGRVLSCSWCNKKFDAISRLKNHIVKHTKEKNFYCDQCGGKFGTQAALIYHIRLHTGERPFPCDLCEESFLSASRRMEHKRRKHFEPSKECPLCHVKFVTGNQLKKHVQRHYNPQSKLYRPKEIMPQVVDNIFIL